MYAITRATLMAMEDPVLASLVSGLLQNPRLCEDGKLLTVIEQWRGRALVVLHVPPIWPWPEQRIGMCWQPLMQRISSLCNAHCGNETSSMEGTACPG